MLDLHYLWAFVLIVGFSAFAQGFMGLGFGIIVMAGVAFTPWDLERASVLTNILLIILNSTIIFAGRRDFRIDWKLVGLIISGEICGVPLGYWFIYAFGSRPVFRLALGVVLVIFAADRVFRPRLAKPLPAVLGIIAGVVAGFLAGAFTAAGPPLALFIYSRHQIPSKAKGTLQVVFMTATLWRLITIIFFGKGVTLHLLGISAMMMPGVIFFAVLGHYLTRRVSSAVFEKVVYTFIGSAGVLNIARFFFNGGG
jgi:uncharacterized membrane protein YfcA